MICMGMNTWHSVALGVMLLATGCEPGDPVAGPTTAPANGGVPTIVVDAHHQLSERGVAGQTYLLSAGPGLVIDSSSFSLRDPQRRARMANRVRIIYESSILTADWPRGGRQVYTLDRSTLTSVTGNAFTGFRPATQAFIAIGYDGTAPGARGEEFVPFWMTSVIFR